jgi:V8-like Glu-specific endopeptidase
MNKLVFALILFATIFVQANTGDCFQVLHDLNLSLPVLIDVQDNGSGTGVFVNSDKGLFLVTAGHVLYRNDDKGKDYLIGRNLTLTAYTAGNELTKILVDLQELTKGNNFKYDSANDVAVIRLLQWKGSVEAEKGTKIEAIPEKDRFGSIPLDFKNGRPTSGIRYFKDVAVSNNVYILGYPTSLSYKDVMFERDRPLVRKGIVAGKYPNQKRIILDCPVYHGNSGGPVLIEDGDKIVPIGIVTQLIPLVEEWKNSIYGINNLSITNSGYSVVIPMDFIVDLVSQF